MLVPANDVLLAAGQTDFCLADGAASSGTGVTITGNGATESARLVDILDARTESITLMYQYVAATSTTGGGTWYQIERHEP